MRHYTERTMVGLLVLASLWFAFHQQWSPASYTLLLAFGVDFDDWTQRPA